MKKADFFKQAGKRFFFDDAFAVADYVKTHCPRQVQAAIKTADDVVRQHFIFDQRWDMERTHIPVVFEGEIDWLHQPGDDPEWIFALNRMRFWITLGQAYALTGEKRYARAFVGQLCHWITTVKREDPQNAKAWRSIEAGLRLEYWLKAMRYFEKSPAVTDEVMALFFQSITEHAEFIMGIWDSYNLMSNWGVLANHGLLLAGIMLPDSPRTREYTAEALRRLEQEIRMQVYRDGSHWEQSPMYHNEVLHCFLDTVQLCERCGVALPQTIRSKTRDMCLYDLYAGKPDGNELMMGDSDEIDQRDLLSRGAYLFGDGVLKSGGYDQPDFDTAWEIGETGLLEYPGIVSDPPARPDHSFADSGNFFFRSGWGEDGTYLHFHCGPLGAGHGHADQLHIDLFSRGEDVLVDAGRYSYVFGGGRVPFKQAGAHNVLMVDGKDYYVCQDSWACRDLTRAVNQKFYADERYGYVEGGHLAYQNDGVLINRRVLYLKPDIVLVCDECYGGGKHRYSQLFHFGEGGNLTGGAGHYIYRGKKVTAQALFLAPGISTSVIPSRISRRYNEFEHNQAVETAFEGTGFTSAFTVFVLGEGEPQALSVKKVSVTSNFKGTVFEDRQVEALTIAYGEHHYTVVIAHEEFASPTDTFLADGCTGFGSAVVFDRALNETQIGTVLLW